MDYFDKNFDKIEKAFPEYDFSENEYLGEGTKGVAYAIGKGVALKITSDKSEALASNAIKGKKLKHTNEIYDVFKVGEDKGQDIYFIFQKTLKELTEEEEDTVEEYIEVLAENLPLSRITLSKLDKEFFVEEMWGLIKEQGRDLDRKMVTKVGEFIYNSSCELASHGIDYHDYHAGNVMVDKKRNFKVIDLGRSIVEGSELEARVLEKEESSRVSFRQFCAIVEAIEAIKENYTDYVDLYSMSRADIIKLAKKAGSDATKRGSWRKFYKYGRSLGMDDDEASRFASRIKDFVYGHSYWRGRKKALNKIPPINKNSNWPERNI